MSKDSLLQGIRVVELATVVMAPSVGAILGDFGAEVIKIESPGRGDFYRYFQDLPGMPDSEIDYCFQLDGRNKKSIVLDLKKERGRDIAHRLIARADVFVTNCHASVLEDLRMTWPMLEALSSRLIYAHGTGYGHLGPEAEKPGYDQVCYFARSGLVDMMFPLEGELGPLGCGTGDHPTGLALYGAILSALYRRERTGKGGYVTTSLLATGAWANSCLIQAELVGATFHDKRPRQEAISYGQLYFRTRDQRLIKLSVVDEESSWKPLCRALGLDSLVENAHFDSHAKRLDNMAELIPFLDDAFALEDLVHWERELTAHEIPYSRVATFNEVANDQQLEAIGMYPTMEHPRYGRVRTVNSPIFLAGEEKVPPGPAPQLGEHSAEVLEGLGYSSTEIEALRVDGIIEGL